MIAIYITALSMQEYFGMTVLNHKQSTLHSVLQISISRIMKCAYMVGFLKFSHILRIALQHTA